MALTKLNEFQIFYTKIKSIFKSPDFETNLHFHFSGCIDDFIKEFYDDDNIALV